MSKRALSGLVIVVLIISTIVFAFKIQPARAEGTVYIRADGSVDPPTAPIQPNGSIYTFTSDISDSIVVQRNNVIIDGNGYTLQSTVDLSLRTNVTVQNTQINAYALYYGVLLNYSSGNSISGNNITNSMDGIRLNHSSGNSISRNNITNGLYGIRLDYSFDNIISGNNITNNVYGIGLASSSDNNDISGNNITANIEYGISLYYSSLDNSISGNNITNSMDGIRLNHSFDNIISGNNITNNRYGIWLEDSYSYNSIYGNNITANNHGGITLYGSSNTTVSKNNITNNGYGIRLDHSFDNIISGNDITNNWAGIELESGSPYNSIYGNNITANMGDGIMLKGSIGNTISGNSIARNWCGINLPYLERDNVIYRNSLVENGVQVSYTLCFAVNIWDKGYPSGGNYWSDYDGNDSYCGPDQNEPGSDGIGDTQYAINENNSDHYPLMGPWTVQGENSTVSPSSNITITFGNVTLEGVTSVNKTQTGPTVPPRLRLAEQYYDIKTTADYSGMVKLAIKYDDANMTLEEEQALQLWHWNSTTNEWEDTTTSVDTESNVVYGETTSLSPFAIVKPFPYDVNGDRYVGIDDIFEAASHFGAESGQPNYEPLCDINNDGYIGIDDIFAVAQHFGQEY